MISDNRQKYKDKDPKKVVPKVHKILKKRWDASASMSVCEIEADNKVFKVTKQYAPSNSQNAMELSTGTKSIHHVVSPDTSCCTCGKWQDDKYPCRHAVAYFRRWMEQDMSWILEKKVNYYYKFRSLHDLYKKNIFPVILDEIRYDKKSKPPPIRVSTGRPKKKRCRRQSQFIDSAESPIVCQKCGERGHNSRTCNKK